MRFVARAVRRASGPVRVLLENRSIAALLIAFALMTLAEWMTVTTLAIDAFRRSGPAAVGLIGLRLFFGALSSVLAVPLVERNARRSPLTVIAASRAVLVGTCAVLAASGASLWILVGLVVVDAVVAAPYRAAQSAVLPVIARRPTELAASVAGISTVKTVSQAVGAGLGGSLLVIASPATLFAVSALMFGAAAVVSGPVAKLRRATGMRVSGASRGGLAQTYKVIHEQGLTAILLVSGLRTFVRGMWISIAVIVSLDLLDAGSAGVGALMLAGGLGSLIAIPLASVLIHQPRLGSVAAAALISCGAPLALMAGIPILGVAMALVAVWGAGMALADVATSAMLYRLLETPLLPRVTAGIEAVKLSLEGLGAFLAPVLVEIIGVRGALIFAAVPLPVVVAAGWTSLHRVDRSGGDRHQSLRLLHAVPCLAHLDIVALESLAGRATTVIVAAGTAVVKQGEVGDRFFVVVAGNADVSIDGFLVGHVGPGGSIGEKALLRAVPRTATVTARDSMELVSLERQDFLESLNLYGGLDALPHDAVNAPVEVPHANKRDRVDLLSRVSLFSHLERNEIQPLADASVTDSWPQGTTMIRQGDVGDRFYILLEGRAAVSIGGTVVSELLPGDQFGEISLLHGVPRTADVTAATPSVTLSLHRDDFLPSTRSRVMLG